MLPATQQKSGNRTKRKQVFYHKIGPPNLKIGSFRHHKSVVGDFPKRSRYKRER